MEQRFCGFCGTQRLPEAQFCTRCGHAFGSARRRFRLPPQWAPAFVLGTVVLVGAGAVVHGTLFPAPKRTVPRVASPAEQNLPESHPPVELPQQVKDAIREVVEQAQASPNDIERWRQAAQVQYRASFVDPSYLAGAASAYQHILEQVPGDLEALRALGNIAYERRQPDVAIAYYEQYLAKKPEDLEVRTDLGTMLLAAGQTDKALATYQAVLQDDPKFFQAHFNLGVAYHGLGKTEEALAAFARARELAPNEQIRAQVDLLLARLKGEPSPETSAPAVAEAESDSFRSAAERIFRKNPVMGPKVDRIEWPSDDYAKVYVRDFPMDQMGPEMQAMFRERMTTRIREQKARFQVASQVRFEVVDAATGKSMTTLTE